MHILANEPSLAYYRLQENIRKSLPSMIDKRFEAEKMQQDLQGSIYDLEYAIGWEFHFQCPISCVYVSLRNFDQKFKTSHFFRRYHEKFITVWKLVDISIIFSFSILQKCWFLFLKICSTVFCWMNSQTVIQISDNFPNSVVSFLTFIPKMFEWVRINRSTTGVSVWFSMKQFIFPVESHFKWKLEHFRIHFFYYCF